MMKKIKKNKKMKYIKAILSVVIITLLVMFPASRVVNADKGESTESTESLKESKIIVSLGDSYSSGEGITPFYGQEKELAEKVQDHDWLAHRSTKSWSGRLTLPSVDGAMAENKAEIETVNNPVDETENENKNWYFVAVSGAKIKHLEKEQKKEYDKINTTGQYKATGDKAPKLAPQLDVFEQLENENKKADYVTMTLGGNDADFSKIITEAVTGSTYLNTSNLANKINSVWTEFYKEDGIADDLREAYRKIEDAAGKQAYIIVAGYPQLLDSSGKGTFFSFEESTIINDAVSHFNDAIERIVNQCAKSNMKICFVSVEDVFEGHGAYSNDEYINKVMLGSRSEDLKNIQVSSSYSVHPNEKGARAYAECVQAKIDELEELKAKEQEAEDAKLAALSERDVVLVLDVSGSMSGTPMQETKKAASNFIETVLDESASVGIVTYSDSATVVSDFSVNETKLKEVANNISIGGGTNIEDGLKLAQGMLETGNADKKIIVLMSDGAPNEGKVGDELIEYADSIKKDGVYIYTLGFFENMGNKVSAQALMEKIASDGCHYEVDDADNLVFFFGDVADQINGQKYIYVRIACPVDVTVTYDGETLCSTEENLATRTDFGSLTFEENASSSDSGSDERVKILRLKDGVDYDIKIEGNGRGYMNYTIGFMDENGAYSDLRKFSKVKITKRTVIDTVAEVSDTTVLNVDEDGDGEYDLTYEAKENSRGELVKDSYMIYIVIGVLVVIIAMAVAIIIRTKKKKNNK